MPSVASPQVAGRRRHDRRGPPTWPGDDAEANVIMTSGCDRERAARNDHPGTVRRSGPRSKGGRPTVWNQGEVADRPKRHPWGGPRRRRQPSSLLSRVVRRTPRDAHLKARAGSSRLRNEGAGHGLLLALRAHFNVTHGVLLSKRNTRRQALGPPIEVVGRRSRRLSWSTLLASARFVSTGELGNR